MVSLLNESYFSQFSKTVTSIQVNASLINATSITSNGTKHRPTWYWILRGVFGFVSVFGNGLVIYLISSRRRLRSQPSPNWFILSLAVADFFVGAFNTPSIFFYTFYVKSDAVVWTSFEFFWNVFLIASSTNICALTLDRYIAVLYPFRYTTFSRASFCGAVIIVAWTLPIIQRIPFVVLKLEHTSKEQYFGYQIFYISIFILLPNVFLLFAYVRIIIVVKEHRKQIRAQTCCAEDTTGISLDKRSNSTRAEQRDKTRSYNGTITVGIVVFIFLGCNGFVLYWLTCHYFFPACKESETTQTFFAMVLLRYVNSVPNFFVYALIKSDFQRELKRLFKCQ